MLDRIRIAIVNLLQQNWFTINYRGCRLKVPFSPRRGKCDCCGAGGQTNRHHWRYRYTRKQVMLQPRLALNYTSELAFRCHMPANAMRILYEEDPNLVIKTTSPKLKKLLELRKNTLNEGEKWEKLQENPQECEKVSKNRTKRTKNKKHRTDGNAK